MLLGASKLGDLGTLLAGLAAIVSTVNGIVLHVVRRRAKDLGEKTDRMEGKLDVGVGAAGEIAEKLREHYDRVQGTYAAMTESNRELLEFLRNGRAGGR